MKKIIRAVLVGLTLTAFMVIAFGVNVQAEEQVIVESNSAIFESDSIINNNDIFQTQAQAKAGPVWSTTSFTVTKSGRKVTAVWKLKTNAIINRVNAVYNIGILGQTTSPGSYSPKSGGVTISQTWTYKKGGTYRINGVAQIYTSIHILPVYYRVLSCLFQAVRQRPSGSRQPASKHAESALYLLHRCAVRS